MEIFVIVIRERILLFRFWSCCQLRLVVVDEHEVFFDIGKVVVDKDKDNVMWELEIKEHGMVEQARKENEAVG